MGSGSCGVVAAKTGRNFIGIEMDAGYFAIAEERIKNAAGEIILTARERATGQMGLFGGDV
jgi:DNA modification methylase